MKVLRNLQNILLISTTIVHETYSARSLRGGHESTNDPTIPAPAATTNDIKPLLAEYAATTNSDGIATDLWNWQPNDCSSCYDTHACKWNDIICYRDKVACYAYQSIMAFLMKSIETACNADPKRMDEPNLVEDAKTMLDGSGIFSKDELDSVKFRFCNLDAARNEWLGRAEALTVSPNKVLFEYAYLDASVEDLAILMAHEMVHILQYRRWGTEVFNCRYTKEIDAGKGFGPENYIEKEAYDKEYFAAATIKSKSYDSSAIP